jgi:hypothetical protein
MLGMAGGMSRRGGLPMSERVKIGAADASAQVECPARRCWVSSPTDGGGRCAGLLVKWSRAPEDCRGQGGVVYLAQIRFDDWVLIGEWVDATLITPLS